MRTVKTLVAILVVCALCLVWGCDELDKAAEVGRDTSGAIREGVSGPAGQHIPVDIRAIILGVAAVSEAAAIAYLAWRKQQDNKITKSIVMGIEETGDSTKELKAEISKQMDLYGVAVAGRKKVVELTDGL